MEPKGASGAFCNTMLRFFVIQLENRVKTVGSRTIDLLKVTQSKGFTPHSRAGSSPGVILYKGEGKSFERGLFFGFLENDFFWKNLYSSWDVTR